MAASIANKTKDMLTTLFTTFSIAENESTPEITTTDYRVCGYHLNIVVTPNFLFETVSELNNLGYFIESITGVDWIEDKEIEVVYDFNLYDIESYRVVVRTRTERQDPRIPSITGIYTGANWHERETRDFFGVDFTGHPHLIPLLLPEDSDFHPLLKDFKA